MIRDALAMTTWWQIGLVILLGILATIPVCVIWERWDDRRERERWDRAQMRAERLEFYRKQAKR